MQLREPEPPVAEPPVAELSVAEPPVAELSVAELSANPPDFQTPEATMGRPSWLFVGLLVIGTLAAWHLLKRKRKRVHFARAVGERLGPYECRTFVCMDAEVPRTLLSDIPLGQEDMMVSTRFSTYWRVPRILFPIEQMPARVFEILTERAVAKLADRMAFEPNPVHAVGRSCAVVAEALQQVAPAAAVREIHLSVDPDPKDESWMHALCARLEARDVRVFLHLRQIPTGRMCELLGTCPMVCVCLHRVEDEVGFLAGDVRHAERLF